MTVSHLLAGLEAQGVLTTEKHAAIDANMQAPHDRLPWYLHALVAVGAWMASFFFLGFVAGFLSLFTHDPNGVVFIIGGALLIAGALFASRQKLGVFVDQTSLAFSVTGHCLIFGGVASLVDGHEFGIITVTSIVLAAALYLIYPDPLHRFLSTGSAFALIWVWMMQDQFSLFGSADAPLHITTLVLGDVLVAMQLGIMGWVFLRPATTPEWWPLGYATAVALLVEEGLSRFITTLGLRMFFGFHGAHVFYAIALVVVLAWISGPPWRRRRTFGEIGLLCAALALGVAGTPASLLALVFLLVGFALQDRFFIVSGVVSLGYFLFMYYYEINVDLAAKSRILLLVGVLFILARQFLKLTFWKGQSTS